MSRPPSRRPAGRHADRPARSRPPEPPDRPRRRLLALAGITGVVATSGCLSALGSSGESNVDVGLGPDRLEYPEGFADEATSLAETYGDHGVWGAGGSGGPDVDAPTYVGAYRDSLSVPGGDGPDDPEDPDGSGDRDPWVVADVAAVAYRLDGGAHRVWLWAGGRARQPDGSLGRSSLTRLSVGATAGEGWALVDYAPRGSFRDGPVPVSLGDRGPAGRTPLPGGGIGVDEEARTGTDGRFEVSWQGIARGVRSVNAVCELRPTGDGEGDRPLEAVATFGVAGGRGAL